MHGTAQRLAWLRKVASRASCSTVDPVSKLQVRFHKELDVALKTLADAFYDELRDVLSAEKQLTKALPKMMKKATSPELKQAFETHLEETQAQIERVEQAFEDTGKSAKAKKCEAMAGLIEEASSMMEEDADPEVMDAILIACAQKVEHYEIATYGTLCTWAKLLGYSAAKTALGQNLAEEEKTDKLLTQLSTRVNQSANA
jgi:ferritin-like metal-binding protein YciE